MDTTTLNKIKDELKKKDEVTYTHSLNVGKLCYDFCLYLGKTKSQACEMEVAGYLHDTGKLGIPDEILNKPGELTDKEYEIIKSHTLYASVCLKNCSYITRIVAWGHHLSYSGGGYPNASLSGKNIPEECRIATICDVYDALTAKRQYKDGMGSDKALSLMENFKQLDPDLLKKFKNMMEERKDV